MNKKNAFAILLILAVFVLGFCLIWRKYAYFVHMSQTRPFTTTQTTPLVTNSPTWSTYRSDKTGFKMKYPPDWKVDENIVYSTDRRIKASGDIVGIEVLFSSPGCDIIKCDKTHMPKYLPIEVFPANQDDTNMEALLRVKGIGVTQLNLKPLTIDGINFNYYNIWENTIDTDGQNFTEPAFVKNAKLYIIQCDTTTGAHMVFNDCNMTTGELEQFVSTFKFSN